MKTNQAVHPYRILTGWSAYFAHILQLVFFLQVAHRATIAHLTASHQNILNSSHRFFKLVKAANSTVHGWMQPNFKLIQDYIVVHGTCKNEENPIKIEGARVLTSLLFDFSDAQGQLTLKSGVEFCRISNLSKLL